MNDIEKRKYEHVKICIENDVQCCVNYWKYVIIEHCALPEINKDDIVLDTRFLGKKLDLPMVITSMTGGYKNAIKINENIAKAASEFGIGMGIGSQRAGIENDATRKTYTVIKDYDIPLKIANIGAPQFIAQKDRKAITDEDIKKIIDMIDANVLAIHLNYLQEAVQIDGDINAKGCVDAIKQIVKQFSIPVILKETGAGISMQTAKKIRLMNVQGVDVGGAGGTSFAGVEYFRTKNIIQKELCKTFWDWGIPAPLSIINCKREKIKNIVGSGGIRTGLDGGKAIAIGADIFGVAYPFLYPATISAEKVKEKIKIFQEELKTTMFLVSANNIEELKKIPVIYENSYIQI